MLIHTYIQCVLYSGCVYMLIHTYIQCVLYSGCVYMLYYLFFSIMKQNWTNFGHKKRYVHIVYTYMC